jgi:hypothetical protein
MLPIPRRHVMGRSLFVALVAGAAISLTGATAAPDSRAAEPDPPRTYKVTADVDGRLFPQKDEVYAVDFLRKGQRVPVECQRYGGLAYGSRLWDLVSRGGETLYVPDRFIKTGTDGRAPEIRRCTTEDRAHSGLIPD